MIARISRPVGQKKYCPHPIEDIEHLPLDLAHWAIPSKGRPVARASHQPPTTHRPPRLGARLRPANQRRATVLPPRSRSGTCNPPGRATVRGGAAVAGHDHEEPTPPSVWRPTPPEQSVPAGTARGLTFFFFFFFFGRPHPSASRLQPVDATDELATPILSTRVCLDCTPRRGATRRRVGANPPRASAPRLPPPLLPLPHPGGLLPGRPPHPPPRPLPRTGRGGSRPRRRWPRGTWPPWPPHATAGWRRVAVRAVAAGVCALPSTIRSAITLCVESLSLLFFFFSRCGSPFRRCSSFSSSWAAAAARYPFG